MSVNNYPNPYKGSCPLEIYASAEMLEMVAGYDDQTLCDQFSAALDNAATDDIESLRWLAVLTEALVGDDSESPPSFQENDQEASR
jgi:hypothetical protein